MINNSIALSAIFLAVLLFVWQMFRHQQWHWLWFSITVWLVISLFSSHFMPRVLGITHLPNAFLWHGYIFVGSAFFWLNHIVSNPISSNSAKPKQKYWQSNNGAVLLTLFCVSSLLIHLAFVATSLLLISIYPSRLSAYAAAFLWQLYFTDPINILLIHIWLMLLFYIHRCIQKQSADRFNWTQLRLGFLLALFWIISAIYQKLQLLFHH